MSDELALEPGPPLRKLEQSILRQDAELDLPEPQTATLAKRVVLAPARRTHPHRSVRAIARAPRRKWPRALIRAAGALVVATGLVVVVLLASAGSTALTARADSLAADCDRRRRTTRRDRRGSWIDLGDGHRRRPPAPDRSTNPGGRANPGRPRTNWGGGWGR
jgi:hypothetical protein